MLAHSIGLFLPSWEYLLATGATGDTIADRECREASVYGMIRGGNRFLAASAESPITGSAGNIETAFWLAISRVPHIGQVRIERLLSRFQTLEAAWIANANELRTVLDPRALSELLDTRSRVDPLRDLARIQERGVAVYCPADAGYPRMLAEISGRPAILYCRGQLLPEDDIAVGIVGTRRATSYGRQAAQEISGVLAAARVTVVSGLARGVDAAAHRAALSAGGRTIAVLGSGVDVIYPGEHRQLAEQIMASGAIVSEQPPDAKPDAQNFPARNRIISGMSLGVVVVEAPMRSGALITATFAADQGREVFVVPGSVFAGSSEGSNALLRDGARIVRNGEDILEDLQLGTSGTARATQASLLLDLDQDERAIFEHLGAEPRHIDELVEATGLPAMRLNALLMTMELKSLIRNHGMQYYGRRSL
jgi:DNA processing protein